MASHPYRRSYRFSDSTQSSSLYLVSIVAYLLGAVGMGVGAVFWSEGMNPRWVLATLSMLLVVAAAYAWQRGPAFTVGEAEVILLAGTTAIAALSFSSHLPVGALRNGIALPLLGAYVGWYFHRRGVMAFYATVAAWLLAVWSQGDGQALTIAGAIAFEAVIGLEIIRMMVERLHLTARVDALTGVLNRLGLDEVGAHRVREARRSRRPLCLAMIDLDDLRSTNNTLGHAAGDALLKRACEEWTSGLDATSVVGRVGGDEFVVLMPDTTPSEAAERVGALQHTASVRWTAGIAELELDESFEQFVRRADQEMYAHKGR